MALARDRAGARVEARLGLGLGLLMWPPMGSDHGCGCDWGLGCEGVSAAAGAVHGSGTGARDGG